MLMSSQMTDFIYRSRWSWADRIAAFLVVAGFFALPYAGQIEGMMFPVADDFEIERTEGDGEGSTRIWGRMTIERPRCSFIATEWHLEGETRSVALPPPVYEEGPRLRPGGVSEFGPWLLDVPERSIGQIRGVSIHQCPLRPWQTITQLYP